MSQARKAALKDAVDNLKAKTGRNIQDNLLLEDVRVDRKSICSEEMEHQNCSKDDTFAESGFMATFRCAVQRAYDSVGDPEKDGVNDADLSNILSKLGYSSEDRETQNILSAVATRTDIDRNNMKFQDIFKLVVGMYISCLKLRGQYTSYRFAHYIATSPNPYPNQNPSRYSYPNQYP